MKILIRDFRITDKNKIQRCYQGAFSRPPLEENLDYKEVDRRFSADLLRKGFGCLVAEVNDNFAGAVWWEEINIKELKERRGEKIADFCQKRVAGRIGFSHILVVNTEFQGLGIGSILKLLQLKTMKRLGYQLVISRFLDKNQPIINLNRRFGFKPTGIKYISKCINGDWPGEWYYRVL